MTGQQFESNTVGVGYPVSLIIWCLFQSTPFLFRQGCCHTGSRRVCIWSRATYFTHTHFWDLHCKWLVGWKNVRLICVCSEIVFCDKAAIIIDFVRSIMDFIWSIINFTSLIIHFVWWIINFTRSITIGSFCRNWHVYNILCMERQFREKSI